MSSHSEKSVYDFGIIKAIDVSYLKSALILHVCLPSRALAGSNENELAIQGNIYLEFRFDKGAKGLNVMKLFHLRL